MVALFMLMAVFINETIELNYILGSLHSFFHRVLGLSTFATMFLGN